MSDSNEQHLRLAIRSVLKESLKNINENEEGGGKITLLDLMKLAIENNRLDLLKVDASTALGQLQSLGVEGTAGMTPPAPTKGVPPGHVGIDPAWKKKAPAGVTQEDVKAAEAPTTDPADTEEDKEEE